LDKYLEQFSKSYVTTIAFLLIVFGIVEFMNASGAIAALSFGIVLGNSRKILSVAGKEASSRIVISDDESFFYSQISFFLKVFLFVYMGILLNLSTYSFILMGLAISIALFLIRPLAVETVIRNAFNPKDKGIMQALIPKGVAAAVLATMPIAYKIPNANAFFNVIVSVIVFTILISTILVFLLEKGYIGSTSSYYAKLFKAIMPKNNKEIKQNKQEDKTQIKGKSKNQQELPVIKKQRSIK
ncbi:unnamed protein product, partial [marine sediment metagenome]